MADCEAGYPNPFDNSGEWYHGTQAHPGDLEHGFQDPMHGGSEWNAWNATLGTHFTADHELARKFAEGEHHLPQGDDDDYGWDDPENEPNPSVVHARLHLHNPKIYESEHDLDHEAYEHEWAAGNHPSKDFPDDPHEREWDEEHERPGMYEVHREFGDGKIPREATSPWGTRNAGHPIRQIWLTTHPDMHGIARRFRERLEAQGHDGIVYGNEWERGAHGRAAPSVIAFHPEQIEITQHHHEAEAHPASEVIRHFAAPMHMQQKLFDMPHDRNVPCPQCGTRVREPEHHMDHLTWQRQHDPEYEPDECEHCGADRNFPEEHAERHSDWVRDQQWHTDWDEEGPGDTLHRGMAMSLPQALHDKVHDPSIPVHERAHALLHHILGGNDPGAARGGLGNFWSSDPDVSKSYAQGTRIRALDGEDGRQTPVMLHIHTPGQEHFETDPDQLREWGVHSYHVEGNREVPIQHGAPLRIRGISWAPPDHGLHAGGYSSGTPEHLSDDGAWQHHEIGGEGIRATASGALSADDIQIQQEELRALASSSEQGLSWDEIGERHPGLYGDPEVHDDADGSDGPSIGDAASYLAFSRPEDPGAENHSVHDLTFHQRTVDPARIDYARHDPWDPRVRQAREGFRGQDPGGRVPPLVLVHRHGVFQVADGHHRAQGADLEHKPVRAYVAYSPHEDESFGDGERGPYHGAETEDRPALTDHNGRTFRITYEGWPHAAVTPAPHTAALVAHFEEPAFHGTRYSFTPGQVLTTEDAPQVNQGFGNGMPDGVYYSGFASVAGVFAESAMGPDGNINARPRVYLIRPLAAIEADPDEEPQFDSHRTARAEVIGEVAWDDGWFDSNGNPVLSERMRRTALITSSSQNPPCYYCHEPLDDEDIRDGASAHDECDDMRWCEACQEHHDDPQVTEDHNSTYTDWGGHYFEDGIHRGITVRLPDDVHAIVHDESRPSAERAAALASYLHANPVDDDYSHGRAAGYGVHWTDHLPTAQAWGSGEGAMFGPSEHERSDPRWTHVVMHAAAPEDDDFETDPEELSRRNMLGYDHARSEREIPLRDQAPVHLNALSWKPAGSPADAWQRHELPANHHAAIASVVEHFDDDDDEGQLAPPYNGEKLFHGTRSILHPGELLTHQQAAEHSNTPDIGTFHNNPHVFATTRGAEAHEWGERADAAQTDRRMHELGRGREVRHDLGHNLNHAYPPRVYEVEPTGHVEPDPEREGMSYRSASPLRVVREVHPLQCYDCPDTGGNEEHWPDHPHHEYLQSLEDEDREDDDDEFGEHEGSLDEDEGDAHDGDGYTTCDQDHEHWGLNGAAGLLIRHRGNDGQTRYLLQHRSPHVQHGNTWSTPGGAMGSSETPERAALREATEELGELPGDLTHAHTHTDDHGGGWAYHTVVVDSPRQFAPRGNGETDWEHSGAGWFTPQEIRKLPLHPGFAATWDRVRHSGALDAGTGLAVPSPSYNSHTASGSHQENPAFAASSPAAIPLPDSSGAADHLRSHDQIGGTQDSTLHSMHTGVRSAPGIGPGPVLSGLALSDGPSPDSLPASQLPASPHTSGSGRSGTHTTSRPSAAASSSGETARSGETSRTQSISSSRSNSTWSSHTATVVQPLPVEEGLYYRSHHRDAPFGREHASTQNIGEPPAPELAKYWEPKPGYSAFWDPHHLNQYHEEMGWSGDKDTMSGRRVLMFRGSPIGEGADGEPRVMPHSDKPEASMSWGQFQKRLEVTPESPTRWDQHTWGEGPNGQMVDDGYRTIGALRVGAAADVPSFTHHYEAPLPTGGYEERHQLVQGPFYHGGRSKRLGEGDQITTGRKTNDWGDEGPKSQYVHFTDDLAGAAEYARQAGGRVYEVEPTGDDVRMGYNGGEWKSKKPLRVRRAVPPEEIAAQAHTGKMVVSANIADQAPRAIAPSVPDGETALSAIAGWLPCNAAETHDMLDSFPVLFTSLHEALSGLASRLDNSPVSEEVTGLVRTMAAGCLTAAEDAAEIAARPLDGPEGMWEGSLAGKA